jgi:ABC-2 type transport system permease protein
VTQTVRGQLTGTHIGSHVIAAIAWSLGIAIVSYVWAVRLYNRRRAADPK